MPASISGSANGDEPCGPWAAIRRGRCRHRIATIRDRAFGPAELEVPAGRKIEPHIRNADAAAVTFGPIIQKELRDVLGLGTVHILNVFLSRDVGHD